MTPTPSRKGARLYRYYVSTDVVRGRGKASTSEPLVRLSADLSLRRRPSRRCCA